jgi:hypothetical protein
MDAMYLVHIIKLLHQWPCTGDLCNRHMYNNYTEYVTGFCRGNAFFLGPSCSLLLICYVICTLVSFCIIFNISSKSMLTVVMRWNWDQGFLGTSWSFMTYNNCFLASVRTVHFESILKRSVTIQNFSSLHKSPTWEVCTAAMLILLMLGS